MINFLKFRVFSALLSVLIFVSFFGYIAYKKSTTGQAFSYSVEFTGGTQILLGFSKPVNNAALLEILEKNGWAGAVTREFSSQEILVRVKEFSNDVTGLGERLRKALEESLGDTKVEILKIDSIGQGIGQALAINSLKAIVLALIIMLLYIAWRFWSIGYALGAVFALFHDAIVILLFFLLFNKEISINVIGAILLILGYSINDTIVIFSKIRDNVKAMRGIPLAEIVNRSINQTLRRTILTSVSTAIIVVSLIVFGGEALRDLSLALLIGIIFGTYSSIFIASPVMLMFNKEK